MILTIWRHGEAGSAATDYARELTPGGREDVSRGASCFVEQCASRDLAAASKVAYSPWVRTHATARLIAQALGSDQLNAAQALQPDSSVANMDSYVQSSWPDSEAGAHQILVSHQPLVSSLIDYYLGEWGAVPPLSPGAYCTLRLSAPAEGCAELVFWALPPEYRVDA